MTLTLRRFCLIAGLLAAGAILCVGAAAEGPAGNLGFNRPINPHWLPLDARQWSGYDHSVLLTDLAQAEPGSRLCHGRRQLGKWFVLPYELADFKGTALSIYPATSPAAVRISTGGAVGWHAIYVGLCTTPENLNKLYDGDSIRARVDSGAPFRRIANNLKQVEPRRDVVAEKFLGVAELQSGSAVEIEPFPHMAATVMYVRLVPLTTAEHQAWEKESSPSEFRTAIATNDGHSWIWPYLPKSGADLLQPSAGLEASDFNQWWFCPLGADLACYPTRVGTIASEGTTDFFIPPYGDFDRAVRDLIAQGVNPLVVARQAAARAGQQFHVVLRPQGFGASMPFEETFNSRFYREHPEWRCVDRQGRQAMYMSYAVSEVRQHELDFIREAVGMSHPDGVGFFFNRGVPLMLWEQAFSRRFAEKYHVDLAQVGAEDPRIAALRAEIMTGFLRDLRHMLDGLARDNGGKRYTISVTTFGDPHANERFGLDVRTWAHEGLVDQIAIANLPIDMEFYRAAVAGTNVRLFPMVTGWDLKSTVTSGHESRNLADVSRMLVDWYRDGATGIAVWDPENGGGYRLNPTQGDSLDLLRYVGHRALLEFWAAHGVPDEHSYPVMKLGDNEYSEWLPNRGY